MTQFVVRIPEMLKIEIPKNLYLVHKTRDQGMDNNL